MLFTHSARGNDDQTAFIEANVLSIFYHEFGHAVIDLMRLPMFGQEEDAADVMSVLLINRLFEEEAAQAIAYDSAFGYINDPEQTEEVEYWDLHGPDEQRYYNHVCLFYGADPERRDGLATDLGLPEERAETCSEEFEQADASWGAVFDELVDLSAGESMVLSNESDRDVTLLNRILAAEISQMNAEFTLPQEVMVVVKECGEPNAFYDAETVSITFCTEFVDHMVTLFTSD
jgi:hypothetical protein